MAGTFVAVEQLVQQQFVERNQDAIDGLLGKTT